MTQREQHPDQDRSQLLARIYVEYDSYIRSIIRFCARNQADQEDIYQEVFLVLFQKAELDHIQDFKSYLYRLVINKANEYLRKKISGESQLKKYMEQKPPETVQEAGDSQELQLAEEIDNMMDLIGKRLSRKEAQAIRLRYKYHYDIDDAAQEMNVQRQTLIRYVSVGLKKLRKVVKNKRRAEE